MSVTENCPTYGTFVWKTGGGLETGTNLLRWYRTDVSVINTTKNVCSIIIFLMHYLQKLEDHTKIIYKTSSAFTFSFDIVCFILQDHGNTKYAYAQDMHKFIVILSHHAYKIYCSFLYPKT